MWYWIVLGLVILALIGMTIRQMWIFHQRSIRVRAEVEKHLDEKREIYRNRVLSQIGHPELSTARKPESQKETETLSPEEMEARMAFMERCFEKYGAKALDINARNREMLGQRRTYQHGKDFFRIDQATFDGIPFFVISSIDLPKLAEVGVMEDVEAFPVTLSEEKLEKEIRYALGVEPYPAKYPEWAA